MKGRKYNYFKNILNAQEVETRTHFNKRGGTEKPYE